MNYIEIGLLVILLLLFGFLVYSYNSGISVNKLIKKYSYPESKFLLFDGMQVHYRVKGNGPYLVLIHGVASSLHTWEGWYNELSSDFTIVSFDVPGFGLTGPNPKHDYSDKMYMQLLDNLLDTLKVKSCYVAGNSFGGYLTWNYALYNSLRVKKIVLLDAAGYNTNRKIENIGFKMAMNPYTKAISHRITPYFLVKKSVEGVYGDKAKVIKKTVRRYYDLMLRKGNREAFSEILLKLHQENPKLDVIKNIQQPTLIMWGSKDRIIDPQDAYKFKSSIKISKLIMYPDAGHIPMEEIPVKTAYDIKNFLHKQL